MGFFSWAAPAFAHFGDRWSQERIDEMADMLRPHLSHRCAVLDLGGGTGALAVHLADALDADVTVLDPSPEMLGYVPGHPRVRAVSGSAENMPLPDGTFDAVVVSDAFHHFRDQDAAVREIARVLKPGGGLLMYEFDRRGLMRLIVWGERLLGEPAAFFAPAELCAYLAERGIKGSCVATSRAAFYFWGVVPGSSGISSSEISSPDVPPSRGGL